MLRNLCIKIYSMWASTTKCLGTYVLSHIACKRWKTNECLATFISKYTMSDHQITICQRPPVLHHTTSETFKHPTLFHCARFVLNDYVLLHQCILIYVILTVTFRWQWKSQFWDSGFMMNLSNIMLAD